MAENILNKLTPFVLLAIIGSFFCIYFHNEQEI